jgi:hypothetical protein
VLDEICQILTDKKFCGKMVVVLAGYQQQIEDLLAVNPGLKSRFSERLVFPDFDAEDAVKLLKMQLDKSYGLEISTAAAAGLPGLMQKVRMYAVDRSISSRARVLLMTSSGIPMVKTT